MKVMMKVSCGGRDALPQHGDHHWSPSLGVTKIVGFVEQVREVMLTLFELLRCLAETAGRMRLLLEAEPEPPQASFAAARAVSAWLQVLWRADER